MAKKPLGVAMPLCIVAAAAVLLLLLPTAAEGHDIPRDILVQTFVKAEGTRLHLVVRAPLEGMLDVEFPTRGPGYLDLEHAEASLRRAARIWIADKISVYEGETRLADPVLRALRVSMQSDRSFGSYETARAHLSAAPLPADTEIYWEQGLLDAWFEYTIASDRSEFAIDPRFARLGLRVVTTLRYLTPAGDERPFEFPGDPGLIRLDPRWHQAALRFVGSGFLHILDGTDHLLFLFCLVIPFRRLRPLILIVTSFTVAHSVTLIASAYNLGPQSSWFPPLVEMLIAGSIVYMALENIVGSNVQRRWIITFGFGLVHGFGFSFALHETLQFAGEHLVTSLLAFNVGVELGQILVLLLLVPVLELLFRHVLAERVGTIILSALVAHTEWHWMTERLEILRQYSWPEFDAAFVAGAMRGLMWLLILAGLVWMLSVFLRRRAEQRERG